MGNTCFSSSIYFFRFLVFSFASAGYCCHIVHRGRIIGSLALSIGMVGQIVFFSFLFFFLQCSNCSHFSHFSLFYFLIARKIVLHHHLVNTSMVFPLDIFRKSSPVTSKNSSMHSVQEPAGVIYAMRRWQTWHLVALATPAFLHIEWYPPS